MNLKQFSTILVVAGSRGFSNKLDFKDLLEDYIQDLNGPILFVSGDATSGADKLIIQYCEGRNLPLLKIPAEWDNLETEPLMIKYSKGKPYNALAGHNRNQKMINIATHLLVFWDGKSPGTRNAIKSAEKRKVKTKIILIDIETN
jgi:hypothetical protein